MNTSTQSRWCQKIHSRRSEIFISERLTHRETGISRHWTTSMVSQAEQCSFQIGNFKPFAMLGGINTSCSLTLSKVCIAFTNSAISVFVPCSSKQPSLFPKSTHPAASNRKGMFWNYEKGPFWKKDESEGKEIEFDRSREARSSQIEYLTFQWPIEQNRRKVDYGTFLVGWEDYSSHFV